MALFVGVTLTADAHAATFLSIKPPAALAKDPSKERAWVEEKLIYHPLGATIDTFHVLDDEGAVVGSGTGAESLISVLINKSSRGRWDSHVYPILNGTNTDDVAVYGFDITLRLRQAAMAVIRAGGKVPDIFYLHRGYTGSSNFGVSDPVSDLLPGVDTPEAVHYFGIKPGRNRTGSLAQADMAWQVWMLTNRA